jgi:hypothetical protein
VTSGFNEEVDTAGKAVPPYEGRRKAGDVDPQEESTKDGVKVGGATGPVADDELKSEPREETERGAIATPAQEEPASESGGADPGPAATGPSHTSGVTRGEDQR